MTTRRTAALMIAAALLVNLAFTWLGAVFDYPDVLAHPPAEALAAFRDAQGAVVLGFLGLALGAAALAPVALGVRQAQRRPGDALGRARRDRRGGRAGDRAAALAAPRARLGRGR